MPGLCQHLDNRHALILNILHSRRGSWTAEEIAEELGLSWRGKVLSVSGVLCYLRAKSLVKSSLKIRYDDLGNEKQSYIVWNITRKSSRLISR
jgi:hypothetical protein